MLLASKQVSVLFKLTPTPCLVPSSVVSVFMEQEQNVTFTQLLLFLKQH